MSLRLPVLVSGDSRTQLLPATNPETGLPLTIPVAATLIFTAKLSKYAPDTEAVFQKVTGAGITFSGSTITVQIVSADTEPLEEYTDLVCDVQLQDVSLGILTIWEGVLPVRLGVTQETTTSVPVYTQDPPLPGGGGDMYTSVYDPNHDGKVNAAVQADAVPWAGVTGHPTTLAGYGITDAIGGGDMLKSVYDPDNDGKVSSAAAADSVPWAGITSKPATFPPSAHSHVQSDVTGLVSALAGKADGSSLTAHLADMANPHAVTKAQVGLGSADNTPDNAKPISTATQAALDGKAASSHTHATTDVIGFTGAAAAAAPVQSVAGLTGAPTAAALRTALALVIGTDVQAFDSDLAAIAALTTTSFGRSLLTQADAAAIRATIGAGVSSFDGVFASLTSKPTTLSGYGITDAQPLDGDLTAIAALTTTGFGRSLLTQADAAAARATLGAGTSSFDGAFSSLTGKPTTLTGYGITDAQGLDAELTALAGLTSAADKLPYFTGVGTAALTTLSAFARTFLDDADAATVRATIGAGTSSFDGTFAALSSKPTTLAGYGITDAQPLDADLTAIAALTTDAFGLALLTKTTAAAIRTYIGAGVSSFDGVFASLTSKPTTLSGYGITDAQPLDSDLTAIAALTTTAFGRSVLTQADGPAVRTLIGAGTSSFDGVFASLTSKPTTLAGYGITDAQGLDADLTAIAALTTTSFGRSVLTQADAAAVRTLIGAGTSSYAGYTLPAATTAALGGVIVPTSGNLAIDGSGNLTVPAASSTVFGVMKTSTGLTSAAGVVTVNASQNITTLSNLTSNGSVMTTGGVGTLTVVANTGTGNNVLATAPTIAGGLITGLTSFGIRSTGAAFDLTLASSEVLTAGRTLSVSVGDAARTLTLSGNPTIADWFNQSVKTTDTPTFLNLTSAIPAGGAAFLLNASTGTANTGSFVRYLRGGTSKWDLGTGISVGSDIFELYDRTGGVSAIQVAQTTGLVTLAGGIAASGRIAINKANGGNVNGSANAAIYLSADESTIQGPGTDTVIRMGGNMVIGANGTMFIQTAGANRITIGSTTVTFSAGITTAAPSGGTAQPVKFGSYVGGAPSATGYQQIEINGTAYKVLVST